MTHVLDTNIITAILKGNDKVKRKAQEALREGKRIHINAISYYEIKRGLLAANATTQLKRFDEEICKKFGLILLDSLDVLDCAAEIYSDLKKKSELIGDADILIAAMVSLRKFVLVTDDKDFDRIDGLRTENWLN